MEAATAASTREISKGFIIGRWKVYPEQNRIISDDKEQHLEPKVMSVLQYLALHEGQVVKRETLINHVWGTVVTDEVLSRAVSLLRNCLEDDPKKPCYVQTVPKVGYRFIHPIELIGDTADQPPHHVNSNPLARGRSLTAAIVAITAIFLFFYLNGNDEKGTAGFADLGEWFNFVAANHQGSDTAISLAVLPFDNLSESKIDAYFSDGLTDEITMSLSKVSGMKVVARRSSYSMKNRLEDVPTIGKLLNVDTVLEGSVRRNGDKIRINAQLSHAADGFLLWSESYERKVDEVFNLQEKVTIGVVKSLQQLSGGQNIVMPKREVRPPDMQAYQLYLNGRFLWKLRGEQPLRQSIELFKQALELDPEFTRSKLALASSMALLPFYSSESIDVMFNRAEVAIREFVPSDDWERGEAESIRGFMAWHNWQWIKAETHFRIAIELAPDNPNTYVWYSQHLSSVGRNADAVIAAERAKELDAVSPVVNDRLGVAYLWGNQDIRAAEQFAIGSQLGFSNSINPGYIIFLIRQKRYNELKSIMEAIHPDQRTKPEWLIRNGEWVFLPEKREEALALAIEAEQKDQLIKPLMQFGLWILIGGIDQAYQRFEQFAGNDNRKYLHPEFIFAREGFEFRDDKRFGKLAKKIELTEYWKIYGEPDYKK
jgi:TolB-like protein/DNA-binding winged helix-turn-helix (wHTH) protein/tetratricopeptide (TPR) repeat protein